MDNLVFCDHSGVRIERLSDSQALVSIRRKLLLIPVYCVMILAVSLMLLLLAIFLAMAFAEADHPLMIICILAFGIPMAVLGIAAWFAVVISLVLAICKRSFLIDVEKRTCTFQGAPRMSFTFRFAEIRAVVICTGYTNGWSVCVLCFSLHGQMRLYRIQDIARKKVSPKSLIGEFQPVATVLSQLVDSRIEVEEYSPWKMKWR